MVDEDSKEHLKISLDELRRLFCEGIESGPHVPAEEVFDRLKAKYEKMARTRGV